MGKAKKYRHGQHVCLFEVIHGHVFSFVTKQVKEVKIKNSVASSVPRVESLINKVSGRKFVVKFEKFFTCKLNHLILSYCKLPKQNGHM